MLKQHYDFIKVYNGLSLEVYDRIIQTAKEVGVPVVGHIAKAVASDRVLESGQKSIEPPNKSNTLPQVSTRR